MNIYTIKKAFTVVGIYLCAVGLLQAQTTTGLNPLNQSANAFVESLPVEQRNMAMVSFDSPLRFDWHYVPRERMGLALKDMNEDQKAKAMAMIQAVLSSEGYRKTQQIIDLENVLRVVENRPANDLRRDPENYSFIIFGTPGSQVWAWRVEGHHLSLHFTVSDGKMTFTPSFMGSNPGKVLADMPQKSRQVLGSEQALAFDLLHALTPDQLKKVLLSAKSPYEIVTGNSRKVSLEKQEGISFAALNASQQKLLTALIQEYLGRYHITLASQQWAKLKADGLGNIHFAWMGDQQPNMGAGKGHYYRIHGPNFLIEFDNTQNDANHIHTVVRDLENDFGDDILAQHYKSDHKKQ